eukprot:6107168-Amphidinium_carterae.1
MVCLSIHFFTEALWACRSVWGDESLHSMTWQEAKKRFQQMKERYEAVEKCFSTTNAAPTKFQSAGFTLQCCAFRFCVLLNFATYSDGKAFCPNHR